MLASRARHFSRETFCKEGRLREHKKNAFLTDAPAKALTPQLPSC